MKKLKMKMLTILGLIMLSACSTDDDNITNNNTPFGMLTSGRWNLETYDNIELDDCEKNSYLIVDKNNNTLTQSFYRFFDNECYEVKNMFEYKVHFNALVEGDEYFVGHIILNNSHGGIYYINKLTPTILEIQKSNSNVIYKYRK